MRTSLISRRRAALAVAAAWAALPAFAQGSYPDKPVRMIVGFPAGTRSCSPSSTAGPKRALPMWPMRSVSTSVRRSLAGAACPLLMAG